MTGLLPVCARYNSMVFNEHFLYKTMAWLLPQLSKPSEKQYGLLVAAYLFIHSDLLAVLEAIGPIALSVTSEMKQFMPDIMVQIRESLAQRG